jgi:molecular chaperone GrpE
MEHKKKGHHPEEEKKKPSPGEEETKETSPEKAEAGETPAEPSDSEKLAALNDKYIRLLAEYDNFRKRKERETGDLIQLATERIVIELLSVIDNLDRATEHRNKTETLEDYARGIALIEDQLRGVLSRMGLEAMNVTGKEFDPTFHDAVMQMETKDSEPGTIVAEVEKGYTLNGRVIRHPKVVVSKAPAEEATETEEETRNG